MDSMKLLILDDIVFSLAVLSKELKSLGHDVAAYSSPDEALLELKCQTDYDAVLCDYSMPDLTGVDFYYECLKQIGTLSNKTLPPFVLFSAHTSQQITKKVNNSGFVDFIEKPFSKEKLEALLLRTYTKENLKKKTVPKVLIYSETTELQSQLELFIPPNFCRFITIPGAYQALTYYKNNTNISSVIVGQSSAPVEALRFIELCYSNKRYNDQGEINPPPVVLFLAERKNPQETISLLQKAYALGIKDIFEAPVQEKQIQQLLTIIGIDIDEEYQKNDEEEDRILLVESVVFTRLLTKKALEKAGYIVDEALSGKEAIQMLNQYPGYKTVITASSVNDMSGSKLLELNKKLQQQKNTSDKNIPFILLENTDSTDDAGFYGSLIKPVNNASLVKLVDKAIGKLKPSLLSTGKFNNTDKSEEAEEEVVENIFDCFRKPKTSDTAEEMLI